MSKKKAEREIKSGGTGAVKRRGLIAISLALSLIAASGALTRWTGILSAEQKQGEKKNAEVTTESFSPGSPSKEYIYAGARLIATEEPAAGQSCSFSISPTSQSFSSSGGTGNVTVTAGTGCAWAATSNATWISVTSGSSGSGNGAVGYSVAVNSGGSRTGAITIAGQTFTVNQGAAGCSYSISPASQNFIASGGTGSVNVTAGAGCSWTATSNASWITITAGSSGTGNGAVSYSVSANAGAARTGTITIAGQTFTVNQSAGGAPPAPTNLTATLVTATSIRLDWSFVEDGISIFKIERKTGTNGTYSQIGSANNGARSFSNTKLAAHTTYCYRVRAYNGQDGPYSNEACATTP